MTPEKRQQLGDRVESRVQHGYSETEVRTWLVKECSISEELAVELMQKPFGKKKKRNRIRTGIVIFFALVGIAFGIILLLKRAQEGTTAEPDSERESLRMLLFGVCFILFGLTGLAHSIPNLLPEKKANNPETTE